MFCRCFGFWVVVVARESAAGMLLVMIWGFGLLAAVASECFAGMRHAFGDGLGESASGNGFWPFRLVQTPDSRLQTPDF